MLRDEGCDRLSHHSRPGHQPAAREAFELIAMAAGHRDGDRDQVAAFVRIDGQEGRGVHVATFSAFQARSEPFEASAPICAGPLSTL
jgi:hypothetical protein